MNKVIFSSNDKSYHPLKFAGIEQFGNNSQAHINSAFIKQRIHERRIDEFFHVDVEAPKKRKSLLAFVGAASGVAISVLTFTKKQNPGLKFNSVKSFKKALNINFGVNEILATGIGGVVGGLLGGLSDRKERHKLDKIEEACFQVMNISLPAIFVGALMKTCSKVKPLNNVPAKIITSSLGILAGANVAVAATNKLDDAFFDKYNKDLDRKFKKKDLLVNIDDILAVLVLAKFPMADKLQAGKILPLVYTWGGYHVGES